jgi:hypothetical protein
MYPERIKWRLVIYCAVGYAAALGVLVPLKIRGQLAPHQDWFKIILAPTLAVAIFPAFVLVASRCRWRR